MFFNEDHLRITKVRTLDGLSPLQGADERPVKKVITAPLNPLTKKLFEDQNTRLPTSLKMKIEVVKGYKPEPAPVADPVDVSALEQRIAELQAQNEALLAKQHEAKPTVTEPVKEKEITSQNESKSIQSKNAGNDSK